MQQGRAIGEIAGTADSQVPTPYQSRYAGIFSKPLVSKISKSRRISLVLMADNLPIGEIAGTADSMVPIPYHVALGPRSSLEESR